MGNSGGSSEDQKADSKDCAPAVSARRRHLLGTGLEALHAPFWQRACLKFCQCPEMLCEAEFKGDAVVHLGEEIPRQPSIKSGVWILWTAFSQVHREDQEESEELTDFKNVAVWPEKVYTIRAKEAVVVKELVATKEILSTFHREN
ncbi:hypothetical protein H1C71_041965 [Ictidomys tridecemlineatus]|nr:hypothetical protein H1C71_041965 [Ictidomys tridecemlineatus]